MSLLTTTLSALVLMPLIPHPDALAGGGDGKVTMFVTDVTFLREEEKLARDVYLMLYHRWHLRIFDNIAQSEQRHMDRMKELLDRHQAPDPVTDDSVGAFTNPQLAALYQDLVKRGLTSVTDALHVGATIEDLDIRDIRAMVERTDDDAALRAFANLECGSRNHMRAFVRQLGVHGQRYAAQYLDAAEVATIIAAPHERCGRQGRRGFDRRGQRAR